VRNGTLKNPNPDHTLNHNQKNSLLADKGIIESKITIKIMIKKKEAIYST